MTWIRLLAPLLGTAAVLQRGPRRHVNRQGWDAYAQTWDDMRARREIPDLPTAKNAEVHYVGDEWSLMEADTFSYGVSARTLREFDEYLDDRILMPHLGAADLRIVEIGPGGGRVTRLLLPRARVLYAVDISKAMLRRLQARFAGDARIVPTLVDGTAIDGVESASLDAAVSFDTFVHLEPWEIFRYLEIIDRLLRPGGIGIIHFSDVETPIGFQLFRSHVPAVVRDGFHYGTFSVMTKGIMRLFLSQLGFEIVSISNDAFPRDAVAVFRKIAG